MLIQPLIGKRISTACSLRLSLAGMSRVSLPYRLIGTAFVLLNLICVSGLVICRCLHSSLTYIIKLFYFISNISFSKVRYVASKEIKSIYLLSSLVLKDNLTSYWTFRIKRHRFSAITAFRQKLSFGPNAWTVINRDTRGLMRR